MSVPAPGTVVPPVTGSPECGLGRRDCPEDVSSDEARVLAAKSLSHLGGFARDICCVLVQPELDSAELRRLGFSSLVTGDELRTGAELPTASVTLVVFARHSTPEAVRLVRGVAPNEGTLVAVVLLPSVGRGWVCPEAGVGKESPSEDPSIPCPMELDEGVRLGSDLATTRAALFDAGTDDVMCLVGGEVLQPWRVMEVVHRTVWLSTKMNDVIEQELSTQRESYEQKLREATQRILWNLPGRELENLPSQDKGLQEWRDEGGHLTGVGDYRFADRLGSGTSGSVFLAEHPMLGECVVKVLSKSRAARSLNSLLCLDREVAVLRFLAPHPNIIKAHDALHTRHHFYLVLDFAGPRDLHKFTVATIKRTGEKTLCPEMLSSFSIQQVAALSHLHRLLICHRDLKPDNWIVNVEGDAVRLADFGFAVQVVAADQPLRMQCGSLPFCAPEVFPHSPNGDEHREGYGGLAADIWSLAVNFMEMLLGPYGVDSLLEWVPHHPQGSAVLLQGLLSLPNRWEALREQVGPALGQVVSPMLVLEPAGRWKIGQVAGTQGLAIGQVRAPRIGVPRSAPPGARRHLVALQHQDQQAGRVDGG